MTWMIDDSLTIGGTWNLPIEQATDPPTYEYNVAVASQDGLTDGEHLLSVYIAHNQPNFIVSPFFYAKNFLNFEPL
jgi:hypothetical protein